MTTDNVPFHRTPVLADLIPGTRVRDIALVLVGTLFIAVSGFILIPLPFTPVPLSLATFAVLLTGAALGPVRGVLSAALYLVLGVVGLPIFGNGFSGWAFASFGYIIGYVVAAVIPALSPGTAPTETSGRPSALPASAPSPSTRAVFRGLRSSSASTCGPRSHTASCRS